MAQNTIVVTDGRTLNPGDLDWNRLHRFGAVQIFERSSPSETIERCRHASVIVTNKTPITRAVIESARSLRMIAVSATGYNVVDTEAADQAGIPVCNVPGYGSDSVAQHTFALVLELTNKVGLHATGVASGAWFSAPDWCYALAPILELRDKTLGIVGMGQIGARVAEIAIAFGMKVIYFNPRPKQAPGKQASMDAVFQQGDFVSLHCPMTKENEGFVNTARIAQMKRSAYLINTARGQLIDEYALSVALRSGVIAGAALDVLAKEPPPSDHPLVGLKNCIITPHNAWLSVEARSRILEMTIANIAAILHGEMLNVVNLKNQKS